MLCAPVNIFSLLVNFLQYNHQRRKLIQLIPIDLSLHNWSSIRALRETLQLQWTCSQYSFHLPDGHKGKEVIDKWALFRNQWGEQLNNPAYSLPTLLVPLFVLAYVSSSYNTKSILEIHDLPTTLPQTTTICRRWPFSRVDKGRWVVPYIDLFTWLWEIWVRD